MKIAIIGAGFTGLTAALRLSKAGHEVHIYEASSQVGGLASGWRVLEWDWALERFYHHIFESDMAICGLVEEIDWRDRLFYRRPQTTQWWNGKAWPLDSPGAVLKFPGLPLIDRLRFGLAVAQVRFLTRDWKKLEQVTAQAWCQKRMGKAYDVLMKPLLEGKFGPYAAEVNMAWLWARFKARTPALGYFEGGFQAFAEAIAAAVKQAGGQIKLGAPVAEVRFSDGQWAVKLSDAVDTCDAVLSTTSPDLLARMAPQLEPEYLGALKKLKSMGAVVMTLALDRPLTGGAYWVNLPKPEFNFLALVEHTNFIEPAHYGGMHLVYCGDYVEADHEYFRMTQEELLRAFLPSLKKVSPDFDVSWVQQYWMHREPYAQPIVGLNHSQNVPQLETGLPKLWWASMSHIYPWDRGTNFSVQLGERVSRLMLESI